MSEDTTCWAGIFSSRKYGDTVKGNIYAKISVNEEKESAYTCMEYTGTFEKGRKRVVSYDIKEGKANKNPNIYDFVMKGSGTFNKQTISLTSHKRTEQLIEGTYETHYPDDIGTFKLERKSKGALELIKFEDVNPSCCIL